MFFLKNAHKLGLDIEKNLDAILLSHGDYDHGNGLKFLEPHKKTNLFAHPDIFLNRISKRTGKYDGLNQNFFEFSRKFNLVLSDDPVKALKNVTFLGQIERTLILTRADYPWSPRVARNINILMTAEL